MACVKEKQQPQNQVTNGCRTHGEVEPQVSVRCGVEVGGAHSPPALLLEHKSWTRLDLSALCPKDSAIYVPAEYKKARQIGQIGFDIYEAAFQLG